MTEAQYVCTVCGYNMVGYHPQRCPFCGASQDRFLSSEECSARFRVAAVPVTDSVTRLNSVPSLGLEHAAYRIETEDGALWIDCPSSFDRTLAPADAITFTHHHFLGASNLYRELFGADVRIHERDSGHALCRGFTFDAVFAAPHEHRGIQAFPIDGHTPGFTFYIFEDVLFVCDYVFPGNDGSRMMFNPYGPEKATRDGGRKMLEILEGRRLATVCGYSRVLGYEEWKKGFEVLCTSS